MPKVVLYTKDYCGFCARAKELLNSKGVEFTEIDVTHDAVLQAEMIERSGRRTVPQIFIDGRHSSRPASSSSWRWLRRNLPRKTRHPKSRRGQSPR